MEFVLVTTHYLCGTNNNDDKIFIKLKCSLNMFQVLYARRLRVSVRMEPSLLSSMDAADVAVNHVSITF